ncbi:uncharacterized protein LOC114444583 isoform X2 [Parambassis ranga]|uniref:Uncharacterized protein LOC114444583 isoform X2 n=1 Tax=Parambassis ranga TaxID=210632 RepID=A0A6P7JE94_9TELE|nr:uncharacterized protein LOC114444583 isoform X2 [Parambassis ranga]
MPGVDTPSSSSASSSSSSSRCGNASSGPGGHEVRDMERLLDLSQSDCPFSSSPLEEERRADSSWSQDGGLQDCGQLERRWVLWHEFMKEHAHLDAWLRLAEQAIASLNSIHVTYAAAKDDLRRFERLRREAASQLVLLDNLTRRNRTLTRMFHSAMRARLLSSARECGRRWDDVSGGLDAITARLQLFVSEWEEFEAQREELTLWLADLDVRLTDVDHLTGNSCEKLRQLQAFQQCVCLNSGRMNTLLQRGEALIQRSEPADAQRIESGLLELLRRCSHVYNNIARTHTRLLSMRLVFEDDWVLSQPTDSGCPSESVLEEEGALDKCDLDVPAGGAAPVTFNISIDHRRSSTPTLSPGFRPAASPHHPPPPPSPSSPTHEHLGLEWDPSVDIGRSVSCDDADSSYFSAGTGLKRRSFLSSFDSRSDVTNDILTQDTDLGADEWCEQLHPGFFSPAAAPQEEALLSVNRWSASTPDRQDGARPVGFDGGRVKAWLGVLSSTPQDAMTSMAGGVETGDTEVKYGGHVHNNQLRPHPNNGLRRHDNTQLQQQRQAFPPPAPSPSHDLKAEEDEEEERPSSEEAERLPSEPSRPSSSSSWALFYLLLAAALALLAGLLWLFLEPPCRRSNRMPGGFYLALTYVNGPPPT